MQEKMRGNHLSGVKCVVNSCHYNEKGDRCTASSIEIQSRDANTVNETDCATYTKQ